MQAVFSKAHHRVENLKIVLLPWIVSNYNANTLILRKQIDSTIYEYPFSFLAHVSSYYFV